MLQALPALQGGPRPAPYFLPPRPWVPRRLPSSHAWSDAGTLNPPCQTSA